MDSKLGGSQQYSFTWKRTASRLREEILPPLLDICSTGLAGKRKVKVSKVNNVV